MDGEQSTLEACREAGLAIMGTTDAPGMEGGTQVRHGLTSPKLAPLEGRFSLTPCGPYHTIVLPERKR